MATEKRLIDANFLDDMCRRQMADEWNKKVAPVSWSEAYKEFLDYVWDAPTVDAVEVVHGRWVKQIKKTLQSFPDDPVFAEAARLLVEQGERIVDLENKLGGWIPVSLGLLPEEYVSVLVCIPTEAPLPTVKEAYLANDCWSTKTWIYRRSDVSHWMPMPQPPEEEQH